MRVKPEDVRAGMKLYHPRGDKSLRVIINTVLFPPNYVAAVYQRRPNLKQ